MRFAFSPYRFSLVLFHSFFFLIRIYACPSSHLTNYLLMWNTFLCGCLLFSCIFFFISLCIYRVSQTVTTGPYTSDHARALRAGISARTCVSPLSPSNGEKEKKRFRVSEFVFRKFRRVNSAARISILLHLLARNVPLESAL